MLNILVVGGCGFVGHALVQELIKDQDNYVMVLDNFSSSPTHPVYTKYFKDNPTLVGIKKGENCFYYKGHSKDINKIVKQDKIDIIFHFGEFSRINQSWYERETVYESNLVGTTRVLDFAVKHNALLIYSASSAILGGNSSSTPYTFTKKCMVDCIQNYEKWFQLKYIITYFYNVYGPGQIDDGNYATVMGIFERQYKNKEPLTVVSPGTQSRCFTHIEDIVSGLIVLYKNYTNNIHAPIGSNDNISIVDLAHMFSDDVIMLKERKGDRTQSTKELEDVLNKYNWSCKHSLYKYIEDVKNEV